MTAASSFTHPALVWGLSAALVPVLIHLLLRPRVRRLRFPALALMRAALTSGQRAHRTRNILLLLLRAALLACAALLLAGPTCAPPGDDFYGSGPVACTIVLDDSLSMYYRPRFDGRATLLDDARERALALVEVSRSWPAGSELAILRAGSRDDQVALTANHAALSAALREQDRDSPHAQPLGRGLRSAARLLRTCPQPARRIVVFTDLTAAAWRDARPAILAGIDGLSVRVVGPPAGPRIDLALLGATVPALVCPASAAVALRVTLGASGVAAECWLIARQDQQVLARVGPLRIPADELRDVTLRLPPMAPGAHAVTLELEPEDLLTFDQRWYVTWQTGPQPMVWLLSPPGAGPDTDVSVLIFANLLAPELLSPQQQRVAVRLVRAEETVDLLTRPVAQSAAADTRERPALIIAFPDVELPPAGQGAVRRAIEAGTTVLLVPGSTARAPDWPASRSLLSEALPTTDDPTAGTAIRWDPTPGDTLSPEVLLELSRCRVYRRVRLGGLLTGVRTVASYVDGLPALISRPLGRGRIMALTTSPDPQWSDLGVRAAGLLAWLHGLVDEALGPATAAAQFTAGDTPQTVFQALAAASLVQVSVQGAIERKPRWVRLSAGVPEQPWPTDVAGIYTIRPAEERGQAAVYAVNWPAEEFDPTPIDRPSLITALGTAQVTLETPNAAETGAPRGLLSRLLSFQDPTGLLGLLLLLLFVAEVAAATRHRVAPPG